VETFVAAPAGFLLAVLWFDLMFDVQVRHAEIAPGALNSISTYYRRVTTDARPMSLGVSVAMLATLVAIVVEIAADNPAWVGWISLPLAFGPMALAITRTVPAAVRLGAATDPEPEQIPIARRVLGDHIISFVCIAAVIAVQLAAVA
jgi:hypothetical protein